MIDAKSQIDATEHAESYVRSDEDFDIRGRGSKRDVVYLGWPIAPSYMSQNAGGGGRGLLRCGVSANEYSCAHGAQINFGDLTSYLTYVQKPMLALFFGSHETSQIIWISKPAPTIQCTVIRFVWVSAKFGTCTVKSVNGSLVAAKMCTFTTESTHSTTVPFTLTTVQVPNLALTHTKRFTVC